MTATADASAAYATASLAGFVAANPGHVRAVRGGVVRAELGADRVRLVIGGGSGHHPAFAGWVGPGLADGAVCGDVFAAPSAARIGSVSRAVAPRRGLILGFGNYAGDVLQFGLAAEQLRAEGIDARTLAVTDDVASAPAADAGRRRGIAGDLVVFKIAAAAAERGLPLDDVLGVAERANLATRTIGVAFSGCTLPGSDHPLFTVDSDMMAIGLGIHGEPGLETVSRPSTDELAALLVRRVLAEVGDLPDERVAVLLNGFGVVNNDALFVLHHHVLSCLDQRGLRVIAPHVGQQVSSLDMAGVSLTVTCLDDELERLWRAPADTASFHRTAYRADTTTAAPAEPVNTAADSIPASTHTSRAAGRIVVAALADAAAAMRRAESRLGELDAVAGDGDHGKGMVRGTTAAHAAACAASEAGAGVGTVLHRAGQAWSDEAGGTSGALWAACLTAAGRCLGDDTGELTAGSVAAAVRAGVDALARLGGAAVGDKTMLDAAVPFADALRDRAHAGDAVEPAWTQASAAARAAADATAHLSAKVGRARVHGARSVGSPDAGAVSFSLMVTAVTTGHSGRSGRKGVTA